MQLLLPLAAPVYVSGRQLDSRIRHATAAELAAIADDLKSGRLVVTKLTGKQADRAVRFASFGFDRDADRAIQRLGADRMLAALDRWTSPSSIH